MVTSILFFLLVGAIAYFHYVQGFFSATISAVLAIIAAGLAVSYHEPIVTGLLGGKFADIAPGMTLAVLFAVIYVALRTLFDSTVPGNLRLPVLADKIGAGVMGVVAGIFCVGVLAIAAQSLPFGASFGMFSRFEINGERDVRLPTGGQAQDTFVYDEMKDMAIDDKTTRHSLYLPADEIVLATVAKLSDDGSLAGSQSLRNVHPNYVEELYASNIGLQVGAKRTALNLKNAKGDEVTVPAKDGIFTTDSLPQVRGEMSAIRAEEPKGPLTPSKTDMILIVRAMVDRNATDSDNKFRLSTGASRLVANRTNYFPVGTLEKGKTVFVNKPDDFLIIDPAGAEKGVDLVYIVPRADVLKDAKAAPGKMEIADGVFIEIKRLGRVELSGRKVESPIKVSPKVEVLRKSEVLKEAAKKGSDTGGGSSSSADGGSSPGAANAPVAFDSVQANAGLPYAISTGVNDKNANNFQTTAATGALADGKFTKLNVNGDQSVQVMSRGEYTVNELAAPANMKLVQIRCTPAGSDAWTWADQVNSFELVDDKDQHYKAHGAYAKVKTPGGADRMVAAYNASSEGATPPKIEGRPTDIWLVFAVPAGTHLKQLNHNGQQLAPTDTTVD